MVNEKNDAIVGLTAEHMNGVLWLTNLWVHHEHRRKGYARRIIMAAIGLYGDQDLWIKVHPYTNRPMDEHVLSRFYETFGFEYTDAPGVMWRRRNEQAASAMRCVQASRHE
jgi:GNAT superfamily N-acetyltransferase